MSKEELDIPGDDMPSPSEKRFFKLLEVSYNCARGGYYQRAANVASQAVEHYKESEDE